MIKRNKKKGRKKKKTIRDNIFEVIKIVSLLCIAILLLEGIYIISKNYFNDSKVIYFDGISDFQYRNNYYIAVGSNNDNDKKLGKAKITKYDSKKEKVWEYIYNKGYNGTFLAVDIDDEENIIAVGSYESDKNEYNDSLRTALLVKYDSKGKVLFEKQFQLLGNSKFTAVKSVSDGYIVTGQSIYDDMILGDDKGGAFLIKYNKEGKLLWKKNYGNSKSATYNNLVINDTNIYVVGKSDSNTGVISKYSMDGELISYAHYFNIDEVGFTGITINSSEIVISGAKNVSSSNTDALIVKYDLDCNYIDETLYNGKRNERYNKIISDKDDNLIVVGIITNNLKNKKFSYDGIIGKYKSNLKKISVLDYGDNQNDYFTQVRSVDNGYLVSGYSSYQEDGYLSKFLTYSDALKVLEVK